MVLAAIDSDGYKIVLILHILTRRWSGSAR